jgi:hypothetical protein
MPDYMQKALKLFQHIHKKTQNQPFPHTPIKYSTKIQYTKQESTASPVNFTEKDIHPKSMRQIPLLRLSGGQHCPDPYWRHCVPVIQFHQRNSCTHQPIT